MIIATVVGNLTKPAITRDAGDTTVTGFSVASNTKVKGEKVAYFIDCSLWGKRGQAVADYLEKGTKVMVSGELTTRVYQEKTYLELRVDQLELLGGGSRKGEEDSPGPKDGSRGGSTAGSRKPAEHKTRDVNYNPDDDDIPFATNVSCDPEELWWKNGAANVDG